MAATVPTDMARSKTQDLVTLWFPHNAPKVMPTGRWYIKGALCFPMSVPMASGTDMVGCGLVGGVCVDRDKSTVVIMQEFEFKSIVMTMGHPITGESNVISQRGLTSHMHRAAATYGVRDWFTATGHDDEYYSNLRQIMADPMMVKGTYRVMPAQLPQDEMVPISHILGKQASKSLFFPSNGLCHQGLGKFAATWDGSRSPIRTPAMQALIAMTWGIHMCPYRQREETI